MDQIKSKGGLKAVVISHPHFYTTYVVWAKVFECPIYTSAEDEVWFCRRLREPEILRLVTGDIGASTEVVKGLTAVKLGGHFPGSLVLHWEKKLFIADTFVTVPVSWLLSLFVLLLSISTPMFSFSPILGNGSVIALSYTSRELASTEISTT